MAVVVLPEPEGPVRQTKGFWGCADKMDAAAELILSWNTSSQRRTNCVSFCMARMMSAMSITRIKSFLSNIRLRRTVGSPDAVPNCGR